MNNKARSYKTRVKNRQSWPNEWSQILSNELIARDLLPIDLARGIGKSPPVVHSWTRGVTTPNPDTIAEVEHFLGVAPGGLAAQLSDKKPSKTMEAFRQLLRQGGHSGFVKALGQELLDREMTPLDLAAKMGKQRGNVRRWFTRGALPISDMVAQVEDALDIERGELEKHIPEGERNRVSREVNSKRMRRLWNNRRSHNNTKTEYEDKVKEGAFWGGHKPKDNGALGRAVQKARGIEPAAGPRTMQIRVRLSVAQTISGMRAVGSEVVTLSVPSSVFVLCSLCRKASQKAAFRLALSKNYFHAECWKVWVKKGNGVATARKSTWSRGRLPDLNQMIPWWLASNILDMPPRAIRKKYEPKYSSVAIAKGITRVQEYIPERWGELFPGVAKLSTNIHRLLRHFPVSEVIEIAHDQHPLSNVTSYEQVLAWPSATPAPEGLWDPGDVSVTPVAQLLAVQFQGRYQTKREAVEAVGLGPKTLNTLLYGNEKHRLLESTWVKLGVFLDLSVEHLKDISRVQNNPLGTIGSKRGTRASMTTLRCESCGTGLQSEARFCQSCGSSVGQGHATSKREIGSIQIADTKLAQIVGEAITTHFGSVSAAAKAVNLLPEVLLAVVRDQGSYLKDSTLEGLSKLTKRSGSEIRGLWAQDHSLATKPLANTKLANLIFDKLNGKFLGLRAAAKAIGMNANTLRGILYGQTEFVFETTAQVLAVFLGITPTRVKEFAKATPDSQRDVPAVPSPDAVQLTFADA